MSVFTDTPAPRSPSLGNGSFSIIRTGIPFFRSERARTRPEGPAPTYKEYHLNRFSLISLQSLQSVPAACESYQKKNWSIYYPLVDLLVVHYELVHMLLAECRRVIGQDIQS
jgi:hypothetical protein